MNRLAALWVLAIVAAACTTAPNPETIATTTVGTTASSSTTAPTSTKPEPRVTEVPPPSSTTTATTATTVAPPSLDELQLAFQDVATGFVQPVLVTAPPDDDRLFVIDQPGTIWIVDGDDTQLFLDLRDAVRFQGEQGLLGLAFHPGYESTGLFYVNYTDGSGATVVREFRVGADRGEADPDSGRTVLRVDQPAGNHNGGMMAFGPDGALWIGMGDGGGANDSFGHGQRADTMLGSMLRIEVGPGAPMPYEIPATNPFAGGDGGRPEVWSIGLRNPWRWSFDGDTIWVADVGQGRLEEINVVDVSAAPVNYGWPVMEGTECFRSATCDSAGLVIPVLDYSHAEGCSVTGGYVYRGSEIPELVGHYLFGDYCGGWIRSFTLDGTTAVDTREWFPPGSVDGLTSFGQDARGEIYVTGADGTVRKLVRA